MGAQGIQERTRRCPFSFIYIHESPLYTCPFDPPSPPPPPLPSVPPRLFYGGFNFSRPRFRPFLCTFWITGLYRTGVGARVNTYSMTIYTYLQNKRMRRCGVAPPPIIFERLQLPQQIIYRRKENLSESPNHQKYWENILVSRFYEQFSRNRRNLGHFRKFEKISNSQNMNILCIILKHVIWRFQIYNLFREIFKFREE